MPVQMLTQPRAAAVKARQAPVVARAALDRRARPGASSLRTSAVRFENDPLTALLARSVDQRLRASSALSPVIRYPGPMVMREDDDDVVEQEAEGWGDWALRQAKNPWVWAGIGLGIGVCGLLYYNRDSITQSVTSEALKHPDLLAKGAELMGPEWVADKAGSYISTTLEAMALGSSISSLSPGEHLLDVKDALMKTIPGGGMVNLGLKVAQQVADNQQLVSTGLEVARQLGPGFVTEVVKNVAIDHGGDIVLSSVQIVTEPMFESAGWVYNKIGSNHW